MSKIFVAKRGFGEYKLAEVELLRETEHVVIIAETPVRAIYGRFYYLPDRLDRNEYQFFEDEQEALYWLCNELRDYHDKLCHKISKLAGEIEILEHRKQVLNESPSERTGSTAATNSDLAI